MKLIFGLTILCLCLSATAGEPLWWTQQKAQLGLGPNLAYNDWDGKPGKKNAAPGLTPQQQMAQQLGQQVGQEIGQEIGKALFGDPQEEERRRAMAAQAQTQAAAQQQLLAQQEQVHQEQLRQQRIQNAAGLRATWDGRDQVMSNELSGVFDLPSAHAPANTASNDASVVDLSGTPAGGSTAFFGSPGNPDPSAVAQALEDVGNDTSVVDLRGTSAGNGNGVVPISLDTPPSGSSGGAGLSTGSTDSAPNVNPVPKVTPQAQVYDGATLQAKIRQVEAAQKTLNQLVGLYDSQRDDWEKMSEDATREGVKQIATNALNLSIAGKQLQLEEKANQLAGEDLPLLRWGLHNEFKVLAHDKEVLDSVDSMQKLDDLRQDSGEATVAEGAERSSKVRDAAWDGVDLFGLVAPGLSALKANVDAGYLILAQYDSVRHIESLDDSYTKYLQAQGKLNNLKRDLIRLENSQAQ